MRGSPLLRSLLVALAIGVVALVLGRITAHRNLPAAVPEKPTHSPGLLNTSFTLSLSSPAQRIELESNGTIHKFLTSERTITGTIPLKPGHPTIFLDIEWATESSELQFAKLTLEPTGHPTQSHTFDSHGDLSDVWEIHLHE